MEKWTRIKPYGEDAYSYWISGIYKVVSYHAGAYHAYFIPGHCENWDDHVSPPPNDCEHGKCWRTLASAKQACEAHFKNHIPAPKTLRRAAEIKASLLIQAEEYKPGGMSRFICPKCKEQMAADPDLSYYGEYFGCKCGFRAYDDEFDKEGNYSPSQPSPEVPF